MGVVLVPLQNFAPGQADSNKRLRVLKNAFLFIKQIL